MAMASATCKHGTNIYEVACGQCDFDRKRYDAAREAYEPLSRNINGGSTGILASVIGREHPHLLGELTGSVAMAVLRKTYDSVCPASGTIFDSVKHPAHDGRLGCGQVIGALYTLGMRPGEDGLTERKFWLDRAYDPDGF